MMQRSRRCSVAGFSLFVVGTILAQEPPAATQPADAPRVELSQEEWNFGVAWQGQPLKHDIVVKNAGTAPLEVVDVKTSCGCTVSTKPKSPLAPGESDKMTIGYDSLKRVGAANQTITLMTNDPARPNIGIRLTGEVRAAYDLAPKDGLVFGQLYQTSAETRTVEIVNKYTDKLALKLKPGQEFGPFTVELKETEPGMRYTLAATTNPPLKVDRYQPNIVLETGIELVPEIKVLVYAFVQPPVAVRPNKLFLPKNSVSEMKRVLRVSHTPDTPLEIKSVRATPDSVTAVVEPPQPGPDGKPSDTFQITVTLPPGTLIPEGVEPSIEITTTAAAPEYQTLVVPIQLVAPPQRTGAPRPTTAPAGVPGPRPPIERDRTSKEQSAGAGTNP